MLDNRSLLLRGLNDNIDIPVSRHTENRVEDFAAQPHLQILIESDEAGMCLVHDPILRHVHNFNHMEYDSDTLHQEYMRDRLQFQRIAPPAHYYPDDDPKRAPVNSWRSNGHLVFSNWINYLYQTTPFDIARVRRNLKPAP